MIDSPSDCVVRQINVQVHTVSSDQSAVCRVHYKHGAVCKDRFCLRRGLTCRFLLPLGANLAWGESRELECVSECSYVRGVCAR